MDTIKSRFEQMAKSQGWTDEDLTGYRKSRHGVLPRRRLGADFLDYEVKLAELLPVDTWLRHEGIRVRVRTTGPIVYLENEAGEYVPAGGILHLPRLLTEPYASIEIES